jgi:hypothetical protein
MLHVAVVSHDAGGAEILSSWLNRAHCPACVAVAGPAESIFRRKCPQAEFLSLDEALTKSSWVLCGTGWQSNFERHAIARGRALGKKTVAFLDHWVNYRQRFEEGGHSVLPDEIWVGDIHAERIARALFDRTPVLLQPNPYVEDLLAEIAAIKTKKLESATSRILYVCEPVADHALAQYGNQRHWGYTEQDALRFFLTNVAALGQPVEAITIRPHPSEQAEKYHWALGQITLPVEFGGKKTLLEETLAADIVVGCESMAMVVGLLAGKRVISTIPPGGRPCQLPHGDIEHMQQLVGGAAHHG